MDEQDIIRGLQEGDHKAVEEMMTRYANRLLRSAYLLCGNEATAQDLLQITLVRAVRAAKQFEGKSSLYTWLHGVLVNVHHHYQRAHQRTVLMEEIPTQPVDPISISGQIDMEEGTAPLAKAIVRLSPEYREIIVLRFFDDLKVGEIAARMSLPLGTAKSRLRRALKHLRLFLEKR